MNEDTDLYKEIGLYIKNSKPYLDDEQINAILEYYNHGEYEMAFEGLLIELISINKYPNDFSFNNWLQVGKLCKIDTLASFDDTIWNRFLVWGNKTEQ
jgi:hypothetical protein